MGDNLIIALIGAAGLLLGNLLNKIGVRAQQRQAEAANKLTEVDESHARIMSENTYLTNQLTAARSEVTKVRAEWEARWGRQMERCRKIIDTSAAMIQALQKQTTSLHARREAESVLGDIAEHQLDDHPTEP